MTFNLSILSFLFTTLLSLFLIGITFMPAQANHEAAPTFHDASQLSGYAWSSNIGWISFAGGNYSVQINPSGTLTGYAWSSNIGWIQFGGLTGCPSGTCAATVDVDANELMGWARALNYGSGWDGWISLNCLNSAGCVSSDYGVTMTSGGAFNSSYAWGDMVIGWTNFSLVTADTTVLCPDSTHPNSCNTDFSGIVVTDLWCRTTESACTGVDVCSGVPVSCSNVVLDGEVTVSPAIIRKGDSVTVTWTMVSPVDSCYVESTDGQSWNNGDSALLTFNTNNFTLYCVPAGGGPDIEVDTASVKVLPNVYES